jgi:hypothetical protein
LISAAIGRNRVKPVKLSTTSLIDGEIISDEFLDGSRTDCPLKGSDSVVDISS